MKNIIILTGALLLAHTATAQMGTTIFAGASDLVGTDKLVSDPPNTYSSSFDGSAIFGSGDALRVADYSTTSKPEVLWNTPTISTGSFRLDLRVALNTPATTDSQDINLRFTNSAMSSIGSQDDVLSTISFEASGKLKVNGSSRHTFVEGVPVALSLIFNASASETLEFTLFGQAVSLDPQTIATFVDGVQMDDKAFSVGVDYDLSTGVGKLGFVGSNNSATGMDYVFDDVVLYTGADISVALSAVPEPSSFALFFGLAALGCASRRRRVAAV